MLNHAEIMGRITHDLELRHTPNGKSVCSFTIGVDRNRKREDGSYDTDWIRIVTWDHTAEFVTRSFEKGKPILVEGRIQTRDYTDKDGNKRSGTEIVAQNVYFCGGERKKSESVQQPYYAPAVWTPTDADVPPEFLE